MSFEITNVTGTNYAEPVDQGVVVVDHDHVNDVVTARLYVQFTAAGPAERRPGGHTTVVATTIDTDGYDTPTAGGTSTLGTWTVNLTATPVPRPGARSGSCSTGPARWARVPGRRARATTC